MWECRGGPYFGNQFLRLPEKNAARAQRLPVPARRWWDDRRGWSCGVYFGRDGRDDRHACELQRLELHDCVGVVSWFRATAGTAQDHSFAFYSQVGLTELWNDSSARTVHQRPGFVHGRVKLDDSSGYLPESLPCPAPRAGGLSGLQRHGGNRQGGERLSSRRCALLAETKLPTRSNSLTALVKSLMAPMVSRW